MQGWRFTCDACGSSVDATSPRTQCDCGGPLDVEFDDVTPNLLHTEHFGNGLVAKLPVGRAEFARVDFMRVAPTPLVPWSGSLSATSPPGVWLKCDQLRASGAYKDRGAAVLVAYALSLEAQRLVVDSSGNAGAALALYAAHAGLTCEVLVPEGTPVAKLRQAMAYGAQVRVIPGDREEATKAALAAVGDGAFYAGHANSAHFHHGVKTWAYEVITQSPQPPAMMVVPYGAGSFVVGVLLGLRELVQAGALARMPIVHAVRKAPSASAGIASGLNASNPARAQRIAQQVQASGGSVLYVGDEEILAAQTELARQGFHVETTSAAAWAGLRTLHVLPEDGPTIVALTGSGLKESS